MDIDHKFWLLHSFFLLFGVITMVSLFQKAVLEGGKMWIGMLMICAFCVGCLMILWFQETIELKRGN